MLKTAPELVADPKRGEKRMENYDSGERSQFLIAIETQSRNLVDFDVSMCFTGFHFRWPLKMVYFYQTIFCIPYFHRLRKYICTH